MKTNKNSTLQKIRNIKMIIMDVDGVMTNGEIVYSEKGDELKIFNVHDGFGISLLRRAGYKTAIITARKSNLVKNRGLELKIDEVSQGHINKMQPYLKILDHYHFEDKNMCYIGDDLLDIGILKRVGFSVAVANAREEVKTVCDYVTSKEGGKGAVREVIDLILKTNGQLDDIINDIQNID